MKWCLVATTSIPLRGSATHRGEGGKRERNINLIDERESCMPHVLFQKRGHSNPLTTGYFHLLWKRRTDLSGEAATIAAIVRAKVTLLLLVEVADVVLEVVQLAEGREGGSAGGRGSECGRKGGEQVWEGASAGGREGEGGGNIS